MSTLVNAVGGERRWWAVMPTLPASAMAKVDFRLVPDMRHDDILTKLRTHLDAQGFEDVRIIRADGENASRTSMDSPFVALVSATARDVYGKEPVTVPTIR